MPVARYLEQPTRMTGPEQACRPCGQRVIPIRSCSRWGLPCRPCCQVRGALLPHLFTLTWPPDPEIVGRAVRSLWRCPWGHPRRMLSGIAVPWSPDFPRGACCHVPRGRPADWPGPCARQGTACQAPAPGCPGWSVALSSPGPSASWRGCNRRGWRCWRAWRGARSGSA